MLKIVAIHQPTFFPWLGLFNKIARSDVFVFLDDVQYQKTGGTWSNRVKLSIGGMPKWFTAPINRKFHGVRSLNELHFLDGTWREDLLKTLSLNYGRHPFFSETMRLIEPLVMNSESNISRYNISVVMAIADRLGLDNGKFRRSSELEKIGTANHLLSSLTLAAGGSVYMCGGGADGYQDERVFSEYGLPLIYQNFQHPEYTQLGFTSFQPGLSIIDAFMNIGVKGTSNLVHVAKH